MTNSNAVPEAGSDAFLEVARHAKQAKDPLAYRTACEAWLLKDCGIHVGDTVKPHYSGESREVLLETFELHWPTGQVTEMPTLVFEGPTVQKRPRRLERASNWCSRKTLVSKSSPPSAYLRSTLDAAMVTKPVPAPSERS
jgi:hypothetical protein